jgi:hypothetical protein
VHPLDRKTFLAQTLKPYATGARAGLPDEFERYLLEPSDTDDAAIQERLDAVRAIWQKGFEHPRFGELARELVAKHDDAMLTLLDPQERARLAAKASEAADAAKRESAEATDRWRKLLDEHVAQGGLTPNSRAALEGLGAKAGVDPALAQRELDAAPVAAPPAVLPPPVREKIRESLRALARNVGEESIALSLYHALSPGGITDDVSEVQRLYQDLVKKQGQQRYGGQTATLYGQVLANVKLYLLDGDPRAYIEGLVLDVCEAMAF